MSLLPHHSLPVTSPSPSQNRGLAHDPLWWRSAFTNHPARRNPHRAHEAYMRHGGTRGKLLVCCHHCVRSRYGWADIQTILQDGLYILVQLCKPTVSTALTLTFVDEHVKSIKWMSCRADVCLPHLIDCPHQSSEIRARAVKEHAVHNAARRNKRRRLVASLSCFNSMSD